MPSILQHIVSAGASLVVAPVLFSLCLLLLPFAVFTTYFAFITLTVRAALVQVQVVAAIIRRQLGIDDDSTNPSSWAPKAKLEELEIYQRKRTPRRQSLMDSSAATEDLELKARVRPADSSVSSIKSTIPILSPSSSNSTIVSPAASRSQSRPPSAHSSFMALRDYEGVGGWYTVPPTPGPAPETASLEWLVSNARLELPEGDASSMTRPRTPEERLRSSSISGRSHRSMVSLQRRGHERSATAGSVELSKADEHSSLRSSSSRASSLLERSKSGIISQTSANEEHLFVGGRRTGENKNKSAVFFGERGSKFALRLAGFRSFGIKKKGKSDTFSSPENSAGEDHITHKENSAAGTKRRKSVSYDLTGGNSADGSGPGSVDGVDTGGLTIWMRP